MPKKNFTLAISTLAMLSATSIQADELLEFDALGTGEEIRADILPVADENPNETPEQRKARKKKEAEEAKKKGTKSTEGKCGKGTCGS
ncbi:MAG: hypothetical protein JSS30_01185 [Verrucomicrobia bacterium]|nr:hypothetical protein [Verrucomicrobiota bacterium]